MQLKLNILPPASNDDVTIVKGSLPAPISIEFEPVGRWFEAFSLRRKHQQTISHNSLTSPSDKSDESADDSDDDDFDDDTNDDAFLKTLDPKEWKSQDHYVVLGLSKLRYKATEGQIKQAYKRKVLKHHPDKRKSRGLAVGKDEDDYFSVITRAWDVLSDLNKRRAFDSVDPTFDDTIPTAAQLTTENFYTILHPVFKRNARWNTKKNVEELGDENSTFEHVNSFYSCWYNFESWREYSYLDEEEKERGENRDERRWIEKQNKAARLKRKKEETSRIRNLVDMAYNADPRVARFKEEEKQKKLAQKQAKKEAQRQRIEEENRIKQEKEEEEKREKEKEEEEMKQKIAAEKQERETQKKALKRERKLLRNLAKETDYFSSTNPTSTHSTGSTEPPTTTGSTSTSADDTRVQRMTDTDRLAELLSLTQLRQLNSELTAAGSTSQPTPEGDPVSNVGEVFRAAVSELDARLAAERAETEQRRRGVGGGGGGSGESGVDGSKAWSYEELQMLIKAVNVFPAGTNNRWEVINSFIQQHVSSSSRSAKEVLFKAKNLQKDGSKLKADAEKHVFDKFEQVATPPVEKIAGDISQRYDSVVEQQIGETGYNPAPWTNEEQRKLEQALKTFPSNTAERWDRIAEVIPNRSRKDCMKRYKELCELVRSKKAAQAAAAAKIAKK